MMKRSVVSGSVSESEDQQEHGFKKGFIFMEIFISYVVFFCPSVNINEPILNIVEIPIEFTLFRDIMITSVSLWVGVLYTYLGENYVGTKDVMMFVGAYSVVAPLICVGMTTSLILHQIQIAKQLLLFNVHASGLVTAFALLWRIVSMEQIMIPRDKDYLRRYIVTLEFFRLIGQFLAQLTTTLNIQVIFGCSVFTLLAYLLCLGAVFINKERIIFEEGHNTVNEYLFCWFRVIRAKIKLLTDFDSIHYNGWFEVSRKYPYTIQFLRSARKFTDLIMLFVVAIPIFFAHKLIWFTTINFQAEVLRKNNFISDMPVIVLIAFLKLITLVCFELIILPLAHAIKLHPKYIHTIIFGVTCAAMGMLSSCLLEQRIEAQIGLVPQDGVGQLRIYNAMPERVSVQSKWFPLRWIEPWESLHVLQVPTNYQTLTTKMTTSFISPSRELISIEYSITAYDGSSHSCIISSGGFSQLEFPDPLTPDRNDDSTLARVYIVSPLVEKEFLGNKTIWLFNSDGSIVKSVEFPGEKNASIFKMPYGTYRVSLRAEPNSRHVVLPDKITFESGGVYLLLMMYSDTVLLPSANRTLIKSFTVVSSTMLSFNWLYPQLIFYSMSDVILHVHVSIFVYLESPPKVRGVIVSLCYAMAQSGFGVHILVELSTRPSSLTLTTYFFICFVSLIYFGSVFIKYKANSGNRYIYPNDTSVFF